MDRIDEVKLLVIASQDSDVESDESDKEIAAKYPPSITSWSTN